MSVWSFLLIFGYALSFEGVFAFNYEPSWDSLDKRPLPSWYDEAKFGIFIHWGLFSVPSFKSEWFWWYWKGDEPHKDYVKFMNDNFKPHFSYADFSSQFTGEFFDPGDWADLFARSGAKYVVLTSKHHEGFTMWPSKYSWNWNSLDAGPDRDVVAELEFAIKQEKLIFGLYFSQFEWFNPLWEKDAADNYTTRFYPNTVSIPQLYELIHDYEPDILWSDGDAGPDYYWKSKEFLAWLYNESPVKKTVVVNDRWGYGVACKHGDFYTCADRYNPGTLQNHKWENCMTIFRTSWGFDRTGRLSDYLDSKELINSLVSTVSCGGNLLLNVGPTHDGRIVPIFQERLLEIGAWLKVNGEAIYGSKPWLCQNDTVTPNVWYTSKIASINEKSDFIVKKVKKLKTTKADVVVYATFFDWPLKHVLQLGCPNPSPETTVRLLGTNLTLQWSSDSRGSGLIVDLSTVKFPVLPSFAAWTLKIGNLKTNEK